MSAQIVPVGLTAGEVLPGLYLETNFALGPAVGSGLTRSMLVLANRISTGTATVDTVVYGPDTPVQLQTEAQMITLGGNGSEAHRLFRTMSAITGGQNGPPVYWVFVTESAGAKATGTVTIATTATGNATHRLWVGNEFVDTGIAKDDTATAIGDNIVLSVNAKLHWPVTAANSSGTVTLTAKQKGLRGNWLRYQAAIIANASIATTTTATTEAFFTGGTTSDSNATALTTISARWFAYIVSAAEDATQVGALTSQVATQALATNGIRQRVVFGSVDTASSYAAISVLLNAPRVEGVWSEKSPWTPGEWAANNAMVYMLEEAPELAFRTNFIGYGNSAKTAQLWRGPAPRLVSAWPTPATLRSVLAAGGTPIGVTSTGKTYIVDRFTTRFFSGSSTQADPRIREAHKVTITDRFADALSARIIAGADGKVIGDDPIDGSPPAPNTATPRTTRLMVFQTVDDFYANSKVQNPEQIKAGSVVQREDNPTSRMGIRVPLQTIDNWRQSAVIIEQVA